MHLKELGWDDFYGQQMDSLPEALTPGRIIRQIKKSYLVHDGDNQHRAVLAGKFYMKADTPLELPVVGDWVGFRGDQKDDQVMIRHLLARKTQFVRKAVLENTRPQVIAANIDVVFIVNGLDRDFNLRRIERYLSLSYESGATPVIILNKTDISPDPDEAAIQTANIAPGVGIFPVSALNGEGLDPLKQVLKPGLTIAFIGSSGAGKSTLVNALLGEQVMTVNAVRESDQRGRHTTTHRELFMLPNGSMIIDTPGLRELQLWGTEETLNESFADIETLAEQCRFSDCSHDREPGCAVKSAVEAGRIDEGRYLNYLKLRKELQYLDGRQDDLSRKESKRQSKMLSKTIKRFNRSREKP